MTADKKALLSGQVKKLTEVLDVLQKDFAEEEFNDETSCLSIVRDSLRDRL